MFFILASAMLVYFLIELYFFFVIKRILSFCFRSFGKGRLMLWAFVLTLAISLGACVFLSYNIWLVFLHHIMIFNLLMRLADFAVSKLSEKKPALWTAIYRLSIIPLFLSAVFFAYGYVNMANIVMTSYTVDAKEITQPVKTALLADIHYGTAGDIDDIRSIVGDINREEVDIAVLCGDIIDENADMESAREVFSELGKIRTSRGIYFVYGNHDCSEYLPNSRYSREDLERVIASSGIVVLADECREITDELILIARLDKSMDRKSVRELLEPADKDKFILMADHQPTDFKEKSESGVSLEISGHTHGGQIFPVGYINTLISQNELCYGMESFGDMTAIVTSGVYGWGFPIRTQGHSEWVLIDIK